MPVDVRIDPQELAKARVAPWRCCRADIAAATASYIWSGPGPAGFPEGPTGTPPASGSSGGTGCRACASRRAAQLRETLLALSRQLLDGDELLLHGEQVRSRIAAHLHEVRLLRGQRLLHRRDGGAERIDLRLPHRVASLSASWSCNAEPEARPAGRRPLRAHPADEPTLRASNRCDARRFLRAAEVIATAHDVELVAAVLRPRALVVPGDDRPLFTPRLRLDAAGIDAVAHEVLLGGRRPAVAEGQVVLVRPALVAVTGDADPGSSGLACRIATF